MILMLPERYFSFFLSFFLPPATAILTRQGLGWGPFLPGETVSFPEVMSAPFFFLSVNWKWNLVNNKEVRGKRPGPYSLLFFFLLPRKSGA